MVALVSWCVGTPKEEGLDPQNSASKNIQQQEKEIPKYWEGFHNCSFGLLDLEIL
jgi:hypothetical protein